MRLINTTTLKQRDIFDSQVPDHPYAILSHTWGDDEVSLQEFLACEGRDRHGWSKIDDCCRLAKEKRLQWIWVDTCCIDKTSSAELSESINSAFVHTSHRFSNANPPRYVSLVPKRPNLLRLLGRLQSPETIIESS